MAQLRDPEDGCPWDVEQTFASVAPFTLEEAYEVDDAIRTGDMAALCDELGDLLFQVVFHAQMAREAGHFEFEDVVHAICDKLVRRHPHVFGDPGNDGELTTFESKEALAKNWEDTKARERAALSSAADGSPDPFEGVPRALPALARAGKLHKRAARYSLPDAPSADDYASDFEAFDCALEAVIQSARSSASNDTQGAGAVRDVFGELLTRCVVVARRNGIDPEDALRGANDAFERSVRLQLAPR